LYFTPLFNPCARFPLNHTAKTVSTTPTTVVLRDLRLELWIGKSIIIIIPTELAEKLHLYFTSNGEELVKQNNNVGNCNNSQHQIILCPKPFLFMQRSGNSHQGFKRQTFCWL
jgi:hypothetical protein